MKSLYLIMDLGKKILKRLKSIDRSLKNIDVNLEYLKNQSFDIINMNQTTNIDSERSEDSNTDNIIGFK